MHLSVEEGSHVREVIPAARQASAHVVGGPFVRTPRRYARAGSHRSRLVDLFSVRGVHRAMEIISAPPTPPPQRAFFGWHRK